MPDQTITNSPITAGAFAMPETSHYIPLPEGEHLGLLTLEPCNCPGCMLHRTLCQHGAGCLECATAMGLLNGSIELASLGQGAVLVDHIPADVIEPTILPLMRD